MLFQNVQSMDKPVKVVLDDLPDGSKIVRLRDKITEITVPGENDVPSTTMYEYEEVAFPLPYDRNESVASITAAFADWWIYGESAPLVENVPTVEQRIADLEDTVLALLS